VQLLAEGSATASAPSADRCDYSGLDVPASARGAATIAAWRATMRIETPAPLPLVAIQCAGFQPFLPAPLDIVLQPASTSSAYFVLRITSRKARHGGPLTLARKRRPSAMAHIRPYV